MHKKVTGLIIRESNYSDEDKYLTILTAELGKIDVFAPGIRRKKNKYGGYAHLFSYGTFTLFENRSSYKLNEGESIYHFFEITKDMEKYALACYMAEVSNIICEEGDSLEMLSLLVYGFSALISDRELSLIKSAFEFRAASINGFTPQIDKCALCQNNENIESPVFMYDKGVIYCKDCYKESDINKVYLTENTLKLMFYILNSPIKRIYNFTAIEDTKDRFTYLSENYLTYILGKRVKSLEFYKSICGGLRE